MNWRTATSVLLSLAAALIWVLQPVLCDLHHMLERAEQEQARQTRSEHHHHGHGRHHHHHHHAHHSDRGAMAHAGQPRVTLQHHCCGGHDRPSVTVNGPTSLALDGAVVFLALPEPTIGLNWAADQELHVHFLIDMPAPPISQGNPCALLCRWVI